MNLVICTAKNIIRNTTIKESVKSIPISLGMCPVSFIRSLANGSEVDLTNCAVLATYKNISDPKSVS